VVAIQQAAAADHADQVSLLAVLQQILAATSAPAPNPAPTPSPAPAPVPQPALSLFHPTPYAQYWNAVTQAFGADPAYYAQFKVDGVALKGHNGLDLGLPLGTPVQAVDDGQVIELSTDPNEDLGFGLYIKLKHAWGESLYAHLSFLSVQLGQTIKGAQILGLSGNTGNSTGPHLHFGLRINPFNRADGWGGFSDPQAVAVYKPNPATAG